MSGEETIELVTMSYRGDYEVCRMLCESVDRFVPQAIAHRLIVPRADFGLFSSLAGGRRVLFAEEDLLPRWFVRVPLPSRAWRRRLRLPMRNIYATPFSLPVRGWIAQQIMKIAAAVESEAEIVVHLDSDVAFVRPLSPERLYADGRVRIFRNPRPEGLETHERWQRAAGELLGLEASSFYGGEYIDSCVVWRTAVARGMADRLEAVSGSDWIRTLARTRHFAEYVLYGVYADKVLGFEAAGLSPSAKSLSHSRWNDVLAGEDEVAAFVGALEPHHLVCHVQSTIGSSLEQRRDIVSRVTAFAARQDGGGV